MKKILWVSVNTPLESQIKELKRLFGDDVEVTQDAKPFLSASDIVKKYDRGGYDDMVLIAPLSVCRVVIESGIRPLYSEMRMATKDRHELSVQGSQEKARGLMRYYNFVRFKRLEAIEMTFSELSDTSS